MARIRSIKPEFWDDDVVGSLSRDARLLFIATWNLADDEGLLRWTAAYLKSQAFMYDDDLGVEDVEQLMKEVVTAGLVFPYKGGVSQQRLAFVVHFRRHQKPNRPQPSKLPPPSLQNREVRLMYGRRDGWECHLCGFGINPEKSEPSPDHLVARVDGGSDYPSNIRSAHLWCNQRRGAKPLDLEGAGDDPATLDEHDVRDARTDSVNDAVNDSPPEGRGGDMERRGGGSARGKRAPRAEPRPATQPTPTQEPPRRCPKHANTRNPGPCGPCGDARRDHDAWVRTQRPKPQVTSTPPCPIHPDQPAGRCPHCESAAVPAPTDIRNRKPGKAS